MQTSVHKGFCEGCPFNVGHPATEQAYNLGCLPGIAEINKLCATNDTAWACHSEPDEVCCGHAHRRLLALEHMDGVHNPGQQ